MYVAAHTTPSAKSTILRFPKGNAQKNPDIEGVGHRFKEKVYKILTIFSTVWTWLNTWQCHWLTESLSYPLFILEQIERSQTLVALERFAQRD